MTSHTFHSIRQRRHPTYRHRTAMTLIEVMVTLALVIGLITSSAGVLIAWNRSNTISRMHQRHMNEVLRLASDFRRLAHQSVDAKLSKEGSEVVLTDSDEHRHYFSIVPELGNIASKTLAASGITPLRQDRYVFRKKTRISFDIDSDSRMATITLTSPDHESTMYRIDARFLSIPGDKS